VCGAVTASKPTIALAALAACAAAPAATAGPLPQTVGAAAKVRRCGSIRVPARAPAYPVSVLQGAISCRSARATLRGYLRSYKQPQGWFCVLGHNTQPYAAKCARTRGRQVVVEAGNPVGYRP
jgi:hypothetical protein